MVQQIKVVVQRKAVSQTEIDPVSRFLLCQAVTDQNIGSQKLTVRNVKCGLRLRQNVFQMLWSDFRTSWKFFIVFR